MGLYISRMLQKILSWFAGDLLINMTVYFIFLIASALSALIFLFAINILVNILDLIFQELAIFQELDLVSLFDSLIIPCFFIFILLIGVFALFMCSFVVLIIDLTSIKRNENRVMDKKLPKLGKYSFLFNLFALLLLVFVSFMQL